MYSYLKGEIIEINEMSCVLEVRDIGFFVNITRKDSAALINKINHETLLFVELIIREDSHSLYGFSEKNNKELFKLLIQLNGIGPKVALTILSDLTSEELSKAILTNDIQTLTGISGIGKKTAERMIIDLKDKIKNFSVGDINYSATNQNKLDPKIEEEATSALLALGYRSNEIKKMLLNVKKGAEKNICVEDLIKLALRSSGN